MKQLIKDKLREYLLEQEMMLENYATNKELIKLTRHILTHWVRIWQSNGEVDLDFDGHTKDYINPNDFDILQEFLKKCNINVRFKENLGAKGEFIRQGDSNNTNYMILIDIKDKHINDIQKEVDFYNETGDTNFQSLVRWTTTEFETTLVHELQHAYDAWRSKGKFGNDQEKERYLRKQRASKLAMSKERGEMTDDDIKKIISARDAYLKLPHEINARFAQAIKEIRVWERDYNSNTTTSVKKWVDFYQDFKLNFYGWDLMGKKVKKGLIRRLAKVYSDGIEDYKEQLRGKMKTQV